MTLEVLPGGADGEDDPHAKTILAPGAPPSPGRPPNHVAVHLEHGEVLAWWGAKDRIQFGLIGLTLGVAAALLALVSAFAPEFWSRPISGLWGPLLVLASPALAVLVREWLARSAVMVTDGAIIEIDRKGGAHRLAINGIAEVGRDWVRGGIRLRGRRGDVHIAPELMDDARAAIASRVKDRVRASTQVVDPAGWLP